METESSRSIGRNFTRIESSPSGIVFIKEVLGPLEDAKRRYDNCIRFDGYQHDHFERPISPVLLDYDDDNRRLVYPYVSDAMSLQELLSDWRDSGWMADHLVLDVLDEIAVLMATLHTQPIDKTAGVDSRMALQGNAPRKFKWLTPEEYEVASGGELDCWRLIHHDSVLHDGIADAARDNIDDSEFVLVHGDTRPDQFLVTDGEVLLLDWEEFGVGLRVKDVAGIAGSLLFESLDVTFRSPLTGDFSVTNVHEHFVTRGREHLGDVGPIIARFIANYSKAGGCSVDPLTLSRHIGVYLLERVIGRSMLSARLSASDKAIAGVARNSICRPELMADLVNVSLEEL